MKQPLARQTLAFWVVSSSLGLGLFTFPRLLAQAGDRGGIFSVAGLLLIEGFAIFVMLELAKRFPGQTLVEIQRRLIGPVPTAVLAIAQALYALAMLAAVHVIFADLIDTVVLQRTPLFAISFVMGLVAFYGAWHGPMSLGRALQLITPITIALLLLGLTLGLSNVRFLQTTPHWSGITTTLHGTLGVTYLLFGVPFLAIYLGWADLRKARSWVWGGFAIEAVLLVLTYIVVLGTLGVPATADLVWPASMVIKLISLPGFLVVRVGYLVIILWSTLEATFFSVTGLAVAVGTAQAVNMPANRFRWLLVPFVLAPSVATLVPVDIQKVYAFLQHYLSWPGLVALLGMPGLTLLLSIVLGKSGPPIWTWRSPTDWDERRLPLGTPPGTLATGAMAKNTPESKKVLRRHA